MLHTGRKRMAADGDFAVIDDFQGADSYEKTIADPSMLITSGSALMALPGM